MNTTCFGRDGSNGCCVLTVVVCEAMNCPFRKTDVQLHADRKKANRLLAKLEKLQQEYIAGKYYGGRMLWRKGGASDDR
jgi:hypothetical protein